MYFCSVFQEDAIILFNLVKKYMPYWTMKKGRHLLMTMVALCLATTAHAQFCWGIKGGVNLVDNSLYVVQNMVDKDHLFSTNSYSGFHIGPKAEARIPGIGLGMEVATYYSLKGMALSDRETFMLNSFQIPLNIKYSFGLGYDANIFVAIGPEFELNIGETDMLINNLSIEGYNDKTAMYVLDKTMLSFNLGIGVTILEQYQVGVNYHFPWGKVGNFEMVDLEEIADDIEKGESLNEGNVTIEDVLWLNEKAAQLQRFSDKIKSGAWQISVAYLF